MDQSHSEAEPKWGWDTEGKHLAGMPDFIRNDPRAIASGWLTPLCKRCAAIKWLEFAGRNSDALRPEFAENVRLLSSSPCRVCNLFSLVKTLGYTHFLGYEAGSHQSSFRGMLRFVPGDGVKLPKAATPDQFAYVGLIAKLEGNVPFPRPVPAHVDFSLASRWIVECKTSHSEVCTPDISTRLHNLQVIDCNTRVVTRAPAICEYVALSYVWGPPTKADSEYVFPTLPARLPQTIEDAITVTQKLGLSYIWIDRYCINQNDPEDKMQQILQMGAIYSSAQLTIVAAAGSGPQHGLTGVSNFRRIPMPYGEVVGSVALVVTSMKAVQEVFESVWASRSWTFQEGFLSRRRLFFTDSIMLYVCGEGLKGDVDFPYSIGDMQERRLLQQFLPLEAPLLATDDFIVQSQAMTSAGRQLKAYSRRQLTYDSDSLNAILGILDKLSKDETGPSYHIWGVPFASYRREYNDDAMLRRVSYEIALNWFHYDPARRRDGFPSWSSIGWDGPIDYNYQDQPMVPDDIDVRVMVNEEATTLDEYATSGLACDLSGLENSPRRLLLFEARTIPLDVRDIDGHNCAILKVAENLDIYTWVHWDENMSAGTQGLVGVIIYRNDQSRRLAMLVLSQRADCYVRAGFIIFDEDYIEWEKMSKGMVRIRDTNDQVTDAQTLQRLLKRPLRFADERRKSIVMA